MACVDVKACAPNKLFGSPPNPATPFCVRSLSASGSSYLVRYFMGSLKTLRARAGGIEATPNRAFPPLLTFTCLSFDKPPIHFSLSLTLWLIDHSRTSSAETTRASSTRRNSSRMRRSRSTGRSSSRAATQATRKARLQFRSRSAL